MNIIYLRPHHIMCINNFVGKGYSDEFVENMHTIINALENGAQIIFKNSCDDLCEKCPNRIDTLCESESKIISLDINTNRILSIEYNKLYTYISLKQKYSNIIKTEEDIKSVCGDCCWIDICTKNIKAMRNA